MNYRILLFALLAAGNLAVAQTAPTASESDEALKLAALQALIAAPPERAMPLAMRVLDGNHSEAVKSRALFVLSQIDDPAAQHKLLEFARGNHGALSVEAVRMIGIGGDPGSLAGLADLYESGDREMKQSVLHAYLIANDADSVLLIASNATDDEDFDAAVNTLGAMGAREQLRQLRDRIGVSASLVKAYAISGDVESLRELAHQATTPEERRQAIHGLMITGDDDGLIELYRSATALDEKQAILQALSHIGSDRVFEIIDETLAEDR